MPSDLSTVHVSRALASLSIELSNEIDSYLLGQLCGRRPVKNLNDTFFQYGRESAGISDTAGQSSVKYLPSVTGPGAPAPVSEYTLTTAVYNAHRYARKTFVSDTEIAKADSPLKPLQDAGRVMAAEIRNDAEFVLSLIAADAGNYPAGNQVVLTTGANGTNWGTGRDGTGTDPLGAISTGRQVVEKIIQHNTNVLACSASSYYLLGQHPDVKTVLQYTDEHLLEGSGVPEILQQLKIARGRAVYNAAKEGAAYSGKYLFTDSTDSDYACAIIAHKPPGGIVGDRDFSSFIWFDAADETTGQHGVTTRAWRDNDLRGWYVEAAQTLDIKPGIVDSNSKITGAYMIGRTDIP